MENIARGNSSDMFFFSYEGDFFCSKGGNLFIWFENEWYRIEETVEERLQGVYK